MMDTVWGWSWAMDERSHNINLFLNEWTAAIVGRAVRTYPWTNSCHFWCIFSSQSLNNDDRLGERTHELFQTYMKCKLHWWYQWIIKHISPGRPGRMKLLSLQIEDKQSISICIASYLRYFPRPELNSIQFNAFLKYTAIRTSRRIMTCWQ